MSKIKTELTVTNPKKYTLADIIRTVNTSTLFILPLFKYDIRAKGKVPVEYPFFTLAFAYGLKNTHLYSNRDQSKEHLYLVLDKATAAADKDLVKSEYDHFHNRMQNNKDCICIYETTDEYVYQLRIPEKYKKDIELIVEARYSETSEDYKHASCIQDFNLKVKSVATLTAAEHPLANFLQHKDIGWEAANKINGLSDMLRDEYDLNIDEVLPLEFYGRFERASNFKEDGSRRQDKVTELINLKKAEVCQKKK